MSSKKTCVCLDRVEALVIERDASSSAVEVEGSSFGGSAALAAQNDCTRCYERVIMYANISKSRISMLEAVNQLCHRVYKIKLQVRAGRG